jgi:hypothetical protein
MEDDAATIPQQNTPSQIKYSDLLSQAVNAVTQERIFVPTNSNTFKPNNVRSIRIPISVPDGHFIDTHQSFLRFTIENTSAASGVQTKIRPDPNYSCVFRRIRWEGSNGAVLEDLNHVNLLNAVLYQYQVPQDHYGSVASIMNGVSATGALVDGKALQKDEQFSAHVQLLSSFWNSEKYCPAGWVKGSPLTLELEIDDPANCFCVPNGSPGTVSYEITNVELVCQTVYFDSAFNNTFGAMLGQIGGVQYHSTGYNSVVNVIAASTNLNVNIPVRAMSLKGLLYSLQDTATVTNQGAYSLSTRLARKMKDFVQYIGGASYPLRKIDISGTNQGHMLSEVLKLFNNLHNIHAGNSLIDGPGSTNKAGATAGDAPSAAYYPSGGADNGCAFAFGYLFENFNGQNMISGLDMSSQSMPVNLRCTFDGTPTDTSILTTFVHSDVIYTLTADGVISVTS